MNELLFTFNSNQFTPTISKSHQPETAVSSSEPRSKRDPSRKNIRTKKMKRYEKVFQSGGLRRHLADVHNEFMGLENITSENLIRISDFEPVASKHQIKTIDNETRTRRPREIALSNSLSHQERYDRKSIQYHLTPNDRRFPDQEKKFEEIMHRKRGLSLKEGPIVSYPSDQKKLPQVFRSKSIAHDQGISSMPSIEKQPIKVAISKEKILNGYKPTIKKVYYQLSRPLRSQKVLPETGQREQSRRSECLNVQDQLPVTPAFQVN